VSWLNGDTTTQVGSFDIPPWEGHWRGRPEEKGRNPGHGPRIKNSKEMRGEEVKTVKYHDGVSGISGKRTLNIGSGRWGREPARKKHKGVAVRAA